MNIYSNNILILIYKTIHHLQVRKIRNEIINYVKGSIFKISQGNILYISEK